ncbi:RNA polymerase sigma factor [Gracilibacillus xinjiangensis]|uniref:RNA polymerase sigma factor n=1 Tax=Gracilibacillus xinjiangensis TaxID=1193282 RepID=A0ABV8WXH5_9BACI
MPLLSFKKNKKLCSNLNIFFVYCTETVGRGERAIQDDVLIGKVKTGNKQALRLLIEKYKHHVFKVAYSVIHDEKEAEDVAQETFIKMIYALPSYQNQGFKTWISRIALHKAIDLKRKKQRQQEDLTRFEEDYLYADESRVDQMLLAKEKEELVQKAINQMPVKFQQVVRLYHFDGLQYKTIADKLDLKETTVKMRLYRARVWMKENWKEEDF